MPKGAELITEFLVKEKVPYVFGICGHGNVGMLDALHDAKEDIELISPAMSRLPRIWPTLISGSNMKPWRH